MVKFGLIAAVVVLLLGGVAGTMMFLGIGPLASLLQGESPDVEVPIMPRGVFVDMETLVVPVIAGNTVEQNVLLVVQFEVAPERADAVKAGLPRLQNAILQDLHDFLPRHLRNRKQVDLVVLKRRMLKSSEDVLGVDAVRDVLFKAALHR